MEDLATKECIDRFLDLISSGRVEQLLEVLWIAYNTRSSEAEAFFHCLLEWKVTDEVAV